MTALSEMLEKEHDILLDDQMLRRHRRNKCLYCKKTGVYKWA